MILLAKTISLIILLLSISINCFSQLKAAKDVIDSMRIDYCSDKNYLKSILKIKESSLVDESLLPPPPSSDKNYYTDYSCKKRYKIPKEELIKLYPFNADSIVLFVFEENEKRIGKMSKEQINGFMDILYNYGFKKIEGIHIPIQDICGCGLPIPDSRLYFYHKAESKYLDIFAKGFVDSFTEEDPYKGVESDEVIYENNNGIYWGGECNETYEKIISFIEKAFKCKLKANRYKSNEYPMPEIIEQNTPN